MDDKSGAGGKINAEAGSSTHTGACQCLRRAAAPGVCHGRGGGHKDQAGDVGRDPICNPIPAHRGTHLCMHWHAWVCICASLATAGCRARQSSHVYSNDVDPCKKLTDGARSCHACAPHRRSTRGPAERVSAPIAPLFGNDSPLAGPQGSSPRLIQHLPPPQAREPSRSGSPRAHRRRGQLASTASARTLRGRSKLQGQRVRCGEPGLHASMRWSWAGGRMGENHSN